MSQYSVEHAGDAFPDAAWRTSRFSEGLDCVEVASTPAGGVAMRHSKAPNGPALVFSASEWDKFQQGIMAGDFNDLTSNGS